jgi:hypothetical protein
MTQEITPLWATWALVIAAFVAPFCLALMRPRSLHNAGVALLVEWLGFVVLLYYGLNGAGVHGLLAITTTVFMLAMYLLLMILLSDLFVKLDTPYPYVVATVTSAAICLLLFAGNDWLNYLLLLTSKIKG